MIFTFVIPILSSCNDGKSQSPDSSSIADITEATIQTTLLDIVKDSKTDYKIIFSEDAGQKTLDAATILVNAIKSYTGVNVYTSGDYVKDTSEISSDAKEILLGQTNRPESIDYANQLRAGEYIIAASENKLVIIGDSASDTFNAVNYFVEYIMKNSTTLKEGAFQYSSENDYTYQKDYYIKSIKIDDADISNYKIVVPEENNDFEMYIAKLFAYYIVSFAGYNLEITTDNIENQYEILIGKTIRTEAIPSDGKYLIKANDKKLEVVCDSVFGYIPALNHMKSNMFKYSISNIAIDSGYLYSGDIQDLGFSSDCSGDFRIVYHNVWGYENNTGYPISNRADIQIGAYDEYNADIFCFEEFGGFYRNAASKLYDYFKDNNYTEVIAKDGNFYTNPIFYRNDIFTLVDNGMVQAFSGDKGTVWAVFQVKASNKYLIVLNSHFSADSNAGNDHEKGEEMRKENAEYMVNLVETLSTKYPGIPLITGGDFNFNMSNENYNIIVNAELIRAFDIALEKNDVCSYNSKMEYNESLDLYPVGSASTAPYSKSIDHILVYNNDNVTINSFYTITDFISATTSDHSPVFVDITLK